jgi:hypothetical protein
MRVNLLLYCFRQQSNKLITNYETLHSILRQFSILNHFHTDEKYGKITGLLASRTFLPCLVERGWGRGLKNNA